MAIQPAISETSAPPPRRPSHRASPPRSRAALSLSAALALVALATPARAEAPGAIPDPVAQALFQDGRDLVDRGQWDAGCTKFEASMLLYPAASTLLNIARCHEHQQRLATAWSAYKRVQVLNRETLGEERKRAIDDVVAAEIARLTPRVPKIKLSMKEPITGVTLRRDGEVLPAAVLGTEVPVDVGEHEIAAEAPGYRPFRARVDAREGTLHELAIDLIPEGQADPRDAGLRPPLWSFVTAGATLALFGASAGFRIDQAFVEGKQDALCKGNLSTGCPPLSAYDPGPDNARKNLDFGLFLGFGAAGIATLAATIYGFVRPPTQTPPPSAGLAITREGAFGTATFHF
ncbi:MAG: hypothetical protein R3B70_25625 [Polyangiaceae bacterium]